MLSVVPPQESTIGATRAAMAHAELMERCYREAKGHSEMAQAFDTLMGEVVLFSLAGDKLDSGSWIIDHREILPIPRPVRSPESGELADRARIERAWANRQRLSDRTRFCLLPASARPRNLRPCSPRSRARSPLLYAARALGGPTALVVRWPEAGARPWSSRCRARRSAGRHSAPHAAAACARRSTTASLCRCG